MEVEKFYFCVSFIFDKWRNNHTGVEQHIHNSEKNCGDWDIFVPI